MRTNKTFYALLATQTLSLLGSRMTSIGVGIWVFTATGKTAPLLLTSFFNELPGMLAGSLAGVIVDRWDRRRVLMLADAGQAVGSVLLMVSFLSGRFEIWHLYTIAFLQGVFATFQGPAERAAITMLVPKAQRERANALKETSFPLAGIFAPVLAGLLYVVVGITGIILIDLATFLVAVTVVFFLHIPPTIRTEESRSFSGGFWKEASGAFWFIASRRALLVVVLYMAFTNFMLNGPLDLTLPYLILTTNSEKLAGTIMGAMSLGAFVGASLIAVWGGTRPRMNTVIASFVLAGTMFLFYGIFRTPVMLAISLFLIVMPLPIMQTMYMSILQVKSPPDLQGRVFALVDQLGYIGSTASFVLTGYLVDHVINPSVGSRAWAVFQPLVGNDAGAGIGLVEVITGIVILLVTVGVYSSASVRTLESTLPDFEANPEG